MQVTIPQLIRTLEARPGARICTVVTRTRPKMLAKHRITKVPNPYTDGLVRIAHRSIILGAKYENLVNKQRGREGNEEVFNAEALWGGAGAVHTRFTVKHKGTGKLYFAYKPAVAEPEHCPVVIRDQWHDNGRQLSESEVDGLEHYLPVIGTAKKQDVEKEVFWRTLDLTHLIALQSGEVYDIDHSIPATASEVPVN
jgi:hypothetical protein